MLENNTKDLTDSEKLNLTLQLLGIMETEGRGSKPEIKETLKTNETRLTAFEAEASRGTRPLLEFIHKQLKEQRRELCALCYGYENTAIKLPVLRGELHGDLRDI
jgi:hypothetical protein